MKKRMLFLLLVLCLFITGCNYDADRVSAEKERLQQTSVVLGDYTEQLTKAAQEAQAILDTLELTPDQAAILQNRILEAEYRLQQIKQYKDQIDSSLQNINTENPFSLLSTGATEVGKFLPAPYNALLSLAGVIAGAVGGVIVKQKQDKQTMKQIIASVDVGLDAIDSSNASLVKQTMKQYQRKTNTHAAIVTLMEN